MANENENSYKTSITVKIAKKHLNAWKKVPKPSGFVNSLISDYFNDGLAKLSLPDDVLEKYNKCDTKEYIVNKLLIEYFRDNVLFVDDFVKINTLQKTIGGTMEGILNTVPRKLNMATSDEEVDVDGQIDIRPFVSEHKAIEELTIGEDTNITIEDKSVIEKGSELHEGLTLDKVDSIKEDYHEVDTVIEGKSLKTNDNNNKKGRNILFNKKS